MKTVKIALVLLLSTFFYNNADAQILRNSFLIGGSMNFDHNSGKTTSTISGPNIPESKSTTNDPTSTVFGISPRFGYFLADNFCLGLNLDFRINSTSQQNTTTTTRLITGPFARYYGALSDNVYLFGEVSFGGGLDSRSVTVGIDTVGGVPTPRGTNVSVTNLQFGAGPGLNFFLNEYIAFEALAKYTYSNATYSFTDLASRNVKNASIGNNIAVTLGLQVYFRALTTGIKE